MMNFLKDTFTVLWVDLRFLRRHEVGAAPRAVDDDRRIQDLRCTVHRSVRCASVDNGLVGRASPLSTLFPLGPFYGLVPWPDIQEPPSSQLLEVTHAMDQTAGSCALAHKITQQLNIIVDLTQAHLIRQDEVSYAERG